MTVDQFCILTRALSFVAIRCAIPISVIDSPCRRRPVVFARSILIHILRHEASLSLNEIGLLVKRDHGTVHYLLRALDNAIETDCSIAHESDCLIREFSALLHHSTTP